MGCHFLLQEIFLTQELNPGLLHCRQILYQLRDKDLITLKSSNLFMIGSDSILSHTHAHTHTHTHAHTHQHFSQSEVCIYLCETFTSITESHKGRHHVCFAHHGIPKTQNRALDLGTQYLMAERMKDCFLICETSVTKSAGLSHTSATKVCMKVPLNERTICADMVSP